MYRIPFIIGITLMLAACQKNDGVSTITLTSRDGEKTVNVQVEVADTPEARRLGLMHRKELGENQGMLFVYEQPDDLRFWMQNTLIPLDIMYFNGAGVFINSYTMEPCIDEDPCPTYVAAEPAQFALEVPGGFRESHGITLGWTLNVKQLQRIIDFE